MRQSVRVWAGAFPYGGLRIVTAAALTLVWGVSDEMLWGDEQFRQEFRQEGENLHRFPPRKHFGNCSYFEVIPNDATFNFTTGRGFTDVSNYDATWKQFTARLPGVEVDWADLYPSWETSKEKLYELDSDVHLADDGVVLVLVTVRHHRMCGLESGPQ